MLPAAAVRAAAAVAGLATLAAFVAEFLAVAADRGALAVFAARLRVAPAPFAAPRRAAPAAGLFAGDPGTVALAAAALAAAVRASADRTAPARTTDDFTARGARPAPPWPAGASADGMLLAALAAARLAAPTALVAAV